ncbi:MAG: MBL fold metallo-hydrolase [Candidatus Bathyarchaeia archaeon]|nr:MBL fold metallo-hydrolase [Candidatus Bathyarchaeota archaeon]
MGVRISFYGGVSEIGGNKIFIEDGDTRVFFDFGASFALRDKFYSTPFLSPKSGSELVKVGLLPDLRGAYYFDESEKYIDAVFLSHSHMDHSAHLSFLRRDIPVYCGETTALILNALNEIRPTNIEFNLKGINFRKFRTGDRIKVGSIEVVPIHVDHSVPGSYGFIIYTSSGPIIYTGDFRRHGQRPELTEDFIAASAKEKPEAVICEHTNMTEVDISSEHEVMEKLNIIVGNTPGLILTEFAYADVDRLKSFYEIALRSNRRLVITTRQAYLLYVLSADNRLKIPSFRDVLVFQKEKKRYFRWEQKIIDCCEAISPQGVSKRQREIIMCLPFFDLNWLVEINPLPGSCYILSASEPFNEEMEIDFNRLVSWLDYYGLPQYYIHVSGHITPIHLREFLKVVKPKRIFPIHGEYPGLLSRFLSDLGSEIILPKKGEVYKI